jgi:putative redox protein
MTSDPGATSVPDHAGSAGPADIRSVTIERAAGGQLTAVNERGGQITVGTGGSDDFSPVELLLAAVGGCTAIDVDILASRRAEPDSFEVQVDAVKVRDDQGNRLTDLQVTFRIAFPATERGDQARAVLPDVVRKSHDRLCTVSRTVEIGTPVAMRIE